ncbi:DegV family protein [Saccharibacillus kuerlensis]|uniref:DegV domain-containing protein n=1 Tax=Saccharibacillus kuerlensis TaxID=459527 RepID=A0ABQ2KUS7_9BACL|nr:DegV family protein [Saccharibacillus kuerlensis]GGN92146.1 degV domain-containing protein [Saccharibacillus kuerlensis]
MSNIRIFSDSTCDLPAELLQQYGIGIVPLYVVFEDETYRDGFDLTPAQLFDKVARQGKLPKSAAPSPADFSRAFAPHIEQGERILYVSLSSELSSTYQNACIAADDFEPGSVTVYDSLNLSTAIGIQVLRAVNLSQSGMDVKEIVQKLESSRSRVETEFAIDTLEYLYKGGRCSGMQNLIGSLLSIRPIIKVMDGKMAPAYKVRGKREKAIDKMLQNFLANKDRLEGPVVVVHAAAEEDARRLRETIIRETGINDVMMTTAGCVISTHCGPGTIGLMYAKSN